MFSLAWTGKRPWLTAPFLAAQNGHVDVLHMLIYGCTVEEADALPGPHHPKRLLVRRSLEKCLLVACRKGHIKIVSLLIGTRRNFFWIRNLNVVVNLKRRLASGLENTGSAPPRFTGWRCLRYCRAVVPGQMLVSTLIAFVTTTCKHRCSRHVERSKHTSCGCSVNNLVSICLASTRMETRLSWLPSAPSRFPSSVA